MALPVRAGALSLVAGCSDRTTVGPEEQPAIQLAKGQSNRAVVMISEGYCLLLDGLGNFVSADRFQKVGTHSGTAKYSCHAKVRPSTTGRAVHYDAYHNPVDPEESVCGIELPSGLFLTTQRKQTVSASGVATLVCRVPQGSEPHEPF